MDRTLSITVSKDNQIAMFWRAPKPSWVSGTGHLSDMTVARARAFLLSLQASGWNIEVNGRGPVAKSLRLTA